MNRVHAGGDRGTAYSRRKPIRYRTAGVKAIVPIREGHLPTWPAVDGGSAGPSGLEGSASPVFALSFGYTESMTAVPLGEARDRLSEYVSEVERTHERVTITRHGHPAAVLISADDLAAIEETLEILGTPGAAEAIREGQADADVGRFVDNDEVKSRYGVA